MATIYLNNGKEIYTELSIEQLKKIQVNSKDFIEIKSEQIVFNEYNTDPIQHQKNYFININSISYIEEKISNYIENEYMD